MHMKFLPFLFIWRFSWLAGLWSTPIGRAAEQKITSNIVASCVKTTNLNAWSFSYV